MTEEGHFRGESPLFSDIQHHFSGNIRILPYSITIFVGIKHFYMKKFFLIFLAALTFCSLKAENTSNEFLPAIENSYLEEMIAANSFAYSQMTDREFLISAFIAENQKRFYTADLLNIKDELGRMSESELLALNGVNFKDPTLSVVLSVLVGGLGVDRFYVGDIGLGVLKLITGGGMGIWWLVDMFVISGRTKKNNRENLQETILLNEAFLSR